MTCRICGAKLPEGALFCGDCGSSTSQEPDRLRTSGISPSDTTRVRVVDRRTGVVSVPLGGFQTIPPVDPKYSPKFELKFGTGDHRVVYGTGLIGRMPSPLKGEKFDHLIQITDITLSVSKTHLEFGCHEGVLWVADRFSVNGTMVHRPDDGLIRCEPGRRYLVPNQSRVEIGQQHFIVG